MPLGYERINEKRSTPNKNIVFLKPRSGPDEATAKDFLERIAAQCVPIMNKHHLAVVSLEEYEPNLEFWGRNFNGGEVIQLVLKSPSTGRWLPFNFVQMVMMHELAHCKEMNHSSAFWKVRNEYSAEIKALWARDYTGDGLWGRGVLLENGAFCHGGLDPNEVLPEHMCGGTFKSRRGKKRKLRPKITYRERQEKKITKKFGTNGVVLGANEEVKAKLENGKKPSGKPRVAGSGRGRELRAAAALSRFENKKEEELVTDTETESEDEKEVPIKTELHDALDIDGNIMLDSDGRNMVKVCEDEKNSNLDTQHELSELRSLHATPCSKAMTSEHLSECLQRVANSASSFDLVKQKERKGKIVEEVDISGASKAGDIKHVVSEQFSGMESSSKADAGSAFGACMAKSNNTPLLDEKREDQLTVPGTFATLFPCPVCSTGNVMEALTCSVCSNVLRSDFVPGSWRCKSTSCTRSSFLNAGDYGICQVCGAKKRD